MGVPRLRARIMCRPILTAGGGHRIRSKKRPKEERVLRDVAPEGFPGEGAVRQSPHERVLPARIREIDVQLREPVVKHSGLPCGLEVSLGFGQATQVMRPFEVNSARRLPDAFRTMRGSRRAFADRTDR